jgi:predicted ATP-dependent endonuclease of OLD family
VSVRRVSIHGYRAVRDLEFEPGHVCALVGEASSGKSTVLTAIWTLLEAAAPPPTIDDVSRVTVGGRIHL